MAPEVVERDPYEILGIAPEASLEQIKRAYRQTSLRVHPDKNPDPQAATTFHALTTAYNLLLDPAQKATLDASLLTKRARAAQLAQLSAKKRALVEDLEERERSYKKRKQEEARQEAGRKGEEERIKEEGRRMREERQAKIEEEERKRQEAAKPKESALGQHDLTLTLRLPPTTPTPSALLSLLTPFGPLDPTSLLIRPPKPPKDPSKKPAKPKGGTAVVQFLTKQGALAAVNASGRKDLGLEGITISWAGGEEPAWVKEALSAPPPEPTALPSFNLDSAQGLDYESITLARMRKLERERLEREIREQEG